MPLVCPNEGERAILDILMGKASHENLILKLFQTASLSGEAATASSFVECTFAGYTPKTFTPSMWTSAVTDGSGTTTIRPVSDFSVTKSDSGSQFIRGYYFVGATTGKLYFFEQFASPVSIAQGDTFRLENIIELR